MSESESAEFEHAAGYLLEEFGYETVSSRDAWLPPEEWARSKDRARRGGSGRGFLARLRRGGE